VEIKIGTPNSTSAFYNNGYEFIVNNYTKAVQGTKLEGKLTFTRDDTLGNAYSSALKKNQVDMLFGVGWTGSALDPYELMEAYISPNYQYDPAYDYSQVPVTVVLSGETYTAPATDWLAMMNGQIRKLGEKTYAATEQADRLAILSALEGAVLRNYNYIPIMDDGEGHLRGRQLKYRTEEYIYPLGYGGVKYFTYAYTDAQWEEFVTKSGGLLDYT
jgi:oligopeptide transport system substrate-binding protein